jgi:hypothetical protein
MHRTSNGSNRLRIFSYNAAGTTFTLEGSVVSTPTDNAGFDESFISSDGTRLFGSGEFLDVYDIDPAATADDCASYVIAGHSASNPFSVVWYEEVDEIMFIFERLADIATPTEHRLYVVDVGSADPCISITILATIDVPIPDDTGRGISAKMHPDERALYINGMVDGGDNAVLFPLSIVTFDESWTPLNVYTDDDISNVAGVPIGFAGWNKQIVLASPADLIDEDPFIANVTLYCIRENVTNPELIAKTKALSSISSNVTDLRVFPQFSLESLASYGWSTQHQIFVATNDHSQKLIEATGVIQMSFCGDGIENTEREGEWPDSCTEGLQCDYPEPSGTGNATCCDTDTCQALPETTTCPDGGCCAVELPVGVDMNLDTGSCVSAPSNTTVCRNATGPCEMDTFYNGFNCTCPPIEYFPNTTICGPSGGVCELNATCTGNNATCPPNEFVSNTTICGPSSGVCENNATCTGESAPCPPNEFVSNTTICDESDGPCENNATCTGESAPCPPKEFVSNTTICDESDGPCENNSTCTGDSAPCPPKEFVSNTTICDESDGPCENNSTCTGDSAPCPPKEFVSNTTICDESDGPCQLNATCTGESAPCPPKVFISNTTICDP